MGFSTARANIISNKFFFPLTCSDCGFGLPPLRFRHLSPSLSGPSCFSGHCQLSAEG